MQHPWDTFLEPKEPTPAPQPTQSLKVRNYYALSPSELDKAIAEMRAWFIDTPNSKHYKKVQLALEVALAAKELQKDDFVQSVIDTLCVE